MQVASLLDPGLRHRGGPRTFLQKWRQIRAAWAMERHWSKSEILETYLNRVPFRGELQGVAAATRVLFGKAPHGITEAEALILASLLRSPNAGHVAVTRRALALRDAVGAQVTPAEIAGIAAQALDAHSGAGSRVALAPHVAHRIGWSLDGAGRSIGPVRTTLDRRTQRTVTEILQRHLLDAKERHVQDGSVLVVDNPTGEVLAYVGSAGGVSSARHVDGIRARRQAGSSLKPFLYTLALERRLLTPASLLEDAPLELAVAGGLYRPRNYDSQFHGTLTARTALAGSVNIPAVRTLELVGLDLFVERLRQLGFAELTQAGDFYGPSLALGSADVSLWELVNAYRTLANGGAWAPMRLRPDEDLAASSRRVYSPQAAFLVSSILGDRESRSMTFGLENPLATRFWTAVKTGTSKDMRDNWCIGFSRQYTVGVWVGNFSGEPMRDVSGVTGAAPVWHEVMAWLHREIPSAPPEPPAGIVASAVSFPRDIEPGRVEWFLDGTEPRTAAQVPAPGHPRITSPAEGTVFALDPDIPPLRQRVVFEARASRQGDRWLLNGRDMGGAAAVLLWEPIPGTHTLSLIDGRHRFLDSISFEVRGGSVVTAPERTDGCVSGREGESDCSRRTHGVGAE
jgi:penicillin-binding protein 1C